MRIKKIAVLGVACVLAACGGGGGSGDKPISPSSFSSSSQSSQKSQQQPLAFVAASVEFYVDDIPLKNELSGGAGAGEVRYETSNANVVQVDSISGDITLVAEGKAIITARKAEDSNYLPASASYEVVVKKREQLDLHFKADAIDAIVGVDQIANILIGGSGDGALTFYSSDSSVAEVDIKTGAVTLLRKGNVTITARKAADGIYSASEASYDINATEVLENFKISLTSTDVEFRWLSPSSKPEITIYYGEACEENNIAACERDVLPMGDTTSVKSQRISLAASGYAMITVGSYSSQIFSLKPTYHDLFVRNGIALFYFDHKVWAMGGINYIDDVPNLIEKDIWSSFDGVHWVREVEDFSPRQDHDFDVFELNKKLYLMGGWESTNDFSATSVNDIWHSTDGKNWELTSTFMRGDECFAHFVFNENMYCHRDSSFSGGNFARSESMEYWSTPVSAPDLDKHWPSIYSSDNKVFILGGSTTNVETQEQSSDNELWSSTDGLNWVLERESTELPSLINAEIFQFKNKWFLIGGSVDMKKINRDLYSSENGVDWVLEKSDVLGDFMMSKNRVFEIDGELFLYPSGYSVIVYEYDLNLHHSGGYIWRSFDGVNWHVPVSTRINWTKQ